MGTQPRPSHREMCPEQYSHPLAGQYVRLVIPGTAKEITVLVERVYANGRGVQEIVVLDTKGGQHFYPIENVKRRIESDDAAASQAEILEVESQVFDDDVI